MHGHLEVEARTFGGESIGVNIDHLDLGIKYFVRMFVGRSSEDSRVLLSQPSCFDLLRLVVCVLGGENDGVILVDWSSRLSVDLVSESLFM